MKNRMLTKIGLSSGLAAAFAVTAWLPTTVDAAEQMKPMKGGEHLLMLQGINTKQDVDALKSGDTIAMQQAHAITRHNEVTRPNAAQVRVVMATPRLYAIPDYLYAISF